MANSVTPRADDAANQNSYFAGGIVGAIIGGATGGFGSALIAEEGLVALLVKANAVYDSVKEIFSRTLLAISPEKEEAVALQAQKSSGISLDIVRKVTHLVASEINNESLSTTPIAKALLYSGIAVVVILKAPLVVTASITGAIYGYFSGSHFVKEWIASGS